MAPRSLKGSVKTGKHWAAFWLELHGRRLGIGRGGPRAAGPRSAKRTYKAVHRGVLVAAEYAMAEGGEDGATAFGIDVSQFKSAIGDDKAASYSNNTIKGFEELTAKKRMRTHTHA